MWHDIRLEAVGVIAEASLELCPGLTVITGETGAGKTMVVTGLELLRGGRADPGLVRHGSPRSRVEARVDLSDEPVATRLAEESGAELEDGVLILGRTVSVEGRSRALLGGATVPAASLASVTDLLVAVHGQSDQQRLLRPAAQRAALDRYAGDPVARAITRYRTAYQRLHEIDDQLNRLLLSEQERLRELDVLRFGLAEVAAVRPVEHEDDDLRAEEERLAHADALRNAATLAHDALAGEDQQAPDAYTAVVTAHRLLEAQRAHDPALAELADRVGEVAVLLSEAATELASYASGLEVEPVRLAEVQERRAALGRLTRKYGPTLADVLDWAKESGSRLAELEAADSRIDQLRGERAAVLSNLLAAADQLSRTRRSAATELSERVRGELVGLAMPEARLEVSVSPRPGSDPSDRLGPDGADDVEFRLAASRGVPARPLSKGASGGELSRVMLALEVVLAGTGSVPTLVFDEVDAGVGGKAAVEVGRRLARLAATAQVVAVTHLPQVAAFAQRHYRVVKSDDGSVTTSGVQVLEPEERVRELSRMLAGLEGSATAEAHARELLEMAADEASQTVTAAPRSL